MHPAALLALLTIALLAFAVLRLELNFRRTFKEGPAPEVGPSEPERRSPEPMGRPRAPELWAAPAGGYWQAPISRPALRAVG